MNRCQVLDESQGNKVAETACRVGEKLLAGSPYVNYLFTSIYANLLRQASSDAERLPQGPPFETLSGWWEEVCRSLELDPPLTHAAFWA